MTDKANVRDDRKLRGEKSNTTVEKQTQQRFNFALAFTLAHDHKSVCPRVPQVAMCTRDIAVLPS